VANLFVVEDSKEAGNLPEWCCTFREAIRGHLDVLARGASLLHPRRFGEDRKYRVPRENIGVTGFRAGPVTPRDPPGHIG